MKSVLDYVLTKVDVYDLCRHYGFYRGPRIETFIHCPFHMENTPSARLYTDGKMYCFGENRLYTPINFPMVFEELSYGEAIKWLEKEYHFVVPPECYVSNQRGPDLEGLDEEILQYKGVMKFRDYHNMWRLYDNGELTQKILTQTIIRGA